MKPAGSRAIAAESWDLYNTAPILPNDLSSVQRPQ